MVTIWFILILAVLGLGSLAAVVFGIVYAIVNKRPGVAVASVLVPVAMFFGVALLVTLLARSSAVVQSSGPARVSWTVGSPMPPMPAVPAILPVPQHIKTDPDVAVWVIILAIIAFVVAVKVFRKHGCQNGERRGWGKAFVVLAIVAVFFYLNQSKQRSASIAHHQARVARELAEQVRLQVKAAQRHSVTATRHAEELPEKAKASDGQSIQELWEKLHQPRIKLDSDEHGGSLTVAEGANQVAVVASEDGEANLVVPTSDKTPQSLARSLTRLERMVEQVANVADHVSDAGTLVGKAMIALNESIDSRSKPAPQQPVAASAPTPPPAPEVQAALADAQTQMDEAHSSLKLVTETRADATAPAADSRPTWINDPPKRVGNTWRQVVVAGEYATADECNRVADIYLLLVTYNHLQQLIGGSLQDESLPALSLQGENVFAAGEPVVLGGHPSDHRLRLVNEMGVGIDYVRREIAKEEFLETVERSFGPMKKLYTILEFSPSVDAELRQRWVEVRRRDRFAMVGVGAGSVLGLIGLAFGLLKIDTWTKGYYTKRLFLGVPAAIIGLLTLLVFASS